MNPQRITLKVINKKEDFYALEEDWHMLLQTIQNKSFFHSYEWHKSFVETISTDTLPLYYFVMYKDDVLIGIFPVEIEIKKRFFLKRTILRNADCFTQDAPIRDFIFSDKGLKENIIDVLLYNLNKNSDFKADCLFIDYVVHNSNIFSLIRRKPLKYAIRENGKNCYLFSLSSYNEILHKYSKKHKYNLRRAKRQLAKLGEVTVEVIKKKKELEPALNAFIALEMSGWKGKTVNVNKGEGQALGLDKDQVIFFNKLINRFTEKEQFEICTIKINNRIVSMLLNLRYNDTLFGLKMVYDEEFAKASPAMVLLDLRLELIFKKNEGLKYLNCLSDALYLEKFNPEKLEGYKYYIFNSNITGLFYYFGTILYNKFFPKGRIK